MRSGTSGVYLRFDPFCVGPETVSKQSQLVVMKQEREDLIPHPSPLSALLLPAAAVNLPQHAPPPWGHPLARGCSAAVATSSWSHGRRQLANAHAVLWPARWSACQGRRCRSAAAVCRQCRYLPDGRSTPPALRWPTDMGPRGRGSNSVPKRLWAPWWCTAAACSRM